MHFVLALEAYKEAFQGREHELLSLDHILNPFHLPSPHLATDDANTGLLLGWFVEQIATTHSNHGWIDLFDALEAAIDLGFAPAADCLPQLTASIWQGFLMDLEA
jgi:hypothetical protein